MNEDWVVHLQVDGGITVLQVRGDLAAALEKYGGERIDGTLVMTLEEGDIVMW